MCDIKKEQRADTIGKMKRSEVLFGLLRIPCDALALAGALLLAWWLRSKNIDLIPGVQILEPAQTLPELPYFTNRFLVPGVILFLMISALLKLYMIRMTLSFFREEARIILGTIVWVGLIMGWFFFVRKELFFSRALLLHATLFTVILTSAGRIILTFVQRALLKRGIGVRRVASVGAVPIPDQVKKFLEKDPRYNYIGHNQGLGYIQNHQEGIRNPESGNGPDSGSRIPDSAPDLILQTDPKNSEDTNTLIDFCRSHHIGYAFLPPVLADVPHLLSVFRFGPVPVLRFRATSLDGWGAVLKRIGDIVISAILLIILSPIFLIIAFLIILDSRGPVFYRSKRVSQGGVDAIKVLKFRSMVKNADELKGELIEQSHRSDGPLFKIKDDPRVTRIGKILRRWSFDELPQFWNVLLGELSLVGPRPHLPEEVARYSDFQKRVFAVRPGITGLAQISGRSDLKFEEEVRYDLQYIEEWSPWMDLWILWRTGWVVIKGEGAD